MTRLDIALGAALVASIGLNIAVRRPPSQPNFEYFPNMVRTARYNAFQPNLNFADGMTLRAPVPGTIPRGLAPLPVAGAGGSTPLENPFSSVQPGATERGAAVFGSFCQPCHGAGALGDGLVVQHGFPQPPSLLSPEPVRLTDAKIFSIVTNGLGQMPSYASQISRDDRWKVILYLRSLQGRSRQRRPPDAPGGGQ
jgi:mono/diheme cytochrome c family protein